jgi:biopolymer transport protein ExbD
MAASNQADGDSISDINIVPLVDIILVVLIIFMVTVPQVVRQQLDVDVPTGSASDAADEKPLEVFITETGSVYLDSQEVTLSEAEAQLVGVIKDRPELQAIVSADRGTDHGLVFEWLDLLKSMGVKTISLASKKGD